MTGVNFFMKADVTAKGAVLLGKYVACDAFDAFAANNGGGDYYIAGN